MWAGKAWVIEMWLAPFFALKGSDEHEYEKKGKDAVFWKKRLRQKRIIQFIWRWQQWKMSMNVGSLLKVNTAKNVSGSCEGDTKTEKKSGVAIRENKGNKTLL